MLDFETTYRNEILNSPFNRDVKETAKIMFDKVKEYYLETREEELDEDAKANIEIIAKLKEKIEALKDYENIVNKQELELTELKQSLANAKKYQKVKNKQAREKLKNTIRELSAEGCKNAGAICLYDAVQYAARKLPEGYIVSVDLELGGWGVDLSDPQGNDIPIDASSLEGDIREATIWAIAHKKYEANG